MFQNNVKKDSLDYWAFGIEVSNPVLSWTLVFFGSLNFFVINTGYPCLIVLSMCLLIQQCVNILSAYEKQLQSMAFGPSCFDTLVDYFCAVEIIRLLKDILSVPLFLALIISLFDIFVSVSSLLYASDSFEVPAILALEMVLTILTGIIILVSLTLYGSKIPESLLKIKETAGMLLVRNAKQKFKYGIQNEMMYLLRRIEKSEIIHMSVCGLIEIRKSFLLTAVGGLCTYGLLILNFKRKDIQQF
ncbi:hypothetical protein JTE90_021026 [Oedothorax gibbosus]|uniref:Gustatory receptor n=1 Tax=Oedothorax gibbosus TaxID=931172 RepID=A0AAV6U5Z8_9ARAC|nr:hypothetical protein JTE90_021026 [Oedothorax gibbosus]